MADEGHAGTRVAQAVGNGGAEPLAVVHDEHGRIVERPVRLQRRIGALPLRHVEPVRHVARLGRSAVGGAHRRADPVALAFEGVRGQADATSPFRRVEAVPVDGHAELPQATE